MSEELTSADSTAYAETLNLIYQASIRQLLVLITGVQSTDFSRVS